MHLDEYCNQVFFHVSMFLSDIHDSFIHEPVVKVYPLFDFSPFLSISNSIMIVIPSQRNQKIDEDKIRHI